MDKSKVLSLKDIIKPEVLVPKEPQLRFTKAINDQTGICIEGPPCCQPEGWEHVIHITGDVYLAYDNTDINMGQLYIGVFE